MSLEITAFPAGPAETNAYLVIDRESGKALIIDASLGVSDEILDAAWSKNAQIEGIVITHAHWDHIGDAAELQSRTKAPLIAHPLDVEALAKPGSSTMVLPFEIQPSTPDRLIDEGDTIPLGEHTFVVMHLPGHEPAHIALYSEPDRVFLGGDVLFPNGHGRIDLPGADAAAMRTSLSRLVELPPDVTVYPGHGDSTTIGREQQWLDEYRSS